MQVARWGNSLALRLPASVVKVLDLKEGDDVTIIAAGEHEIAIKRKPLPAELVERLRKYEGRLPADFKFDRLEANAR